MNKLVKVIMKKQGIQIQLTVQLSSQQNGVVEQKFILSYRNDKMNVD